MVFSRSKMPKMIAKFNRECPVGTEVVVTKDNGSQVFDVVMHEATILGGHTPVAWLRGLGSYSLDRIRKRPPMPGVIN